MTAMEAEFLHFAVKYEKYLSFFSHSRKKDGTEKEMRRGTVTCTLPLKRYANKCDK
jgi:hypothetical protein